MTDIPIIFSAPMVQAFLTGQKTMTRRMAYRPARKGEASSEGSRLGYVLDDNGFTGTITKHERPSPWQRVKAGDRLWVRETWQLHSKATDFGCVVYRASIPGSWTEAHELVPVSKLIGKRVQPKPFQLGWRSPLHLFRELSRITLNVTGAKSERLQDISEADALAEGIEFREGCFGTWNPDGTMRCGGADNAREAFRCLWLNLHGTGSWEANPTVVALTVQVVKSNIDAPEAIAA